MDDVLHALADGSRRTVLEILSDHPASAGELADALPIARPGVSRHLRVLREAGLVDVRQQAQRRIYSLRPAPLAEVDAWLEGYRALWRNRLDALHTEVVRKKPPAKRRWSMKTIGTMRKLDAQRGAVRVEDVYDTDIDDLWDACTVPERLARWIAEVSGDLRLGGTFDASFVSTWTGPGRVDVCSRPDHLLLTMEPGTADEAQIEAWLRREGDKTRLIVEERGLPLDRLHFHGAGWQAHLEDLARSLVGEPSVWKARWTELTPAYAAMPRS